MRQQQGEPLHLAPLRLAGDDEAVDDHLAGVAEVAELRLPEDQRVRLGGRVAVLEAEAGGLRERAVVELERRLGVVEVLHRAVLAARSSRRAGRGGGGRRCRARCPGR